MVIFTEVMANLVKELGATAPVSLTVTEDSIVISTVAPVKKTAVPTEEAPARVDKRVRYYTYNDETLSSKEWAKRYGVSVSTICSRFRRHGSPEPLIKVKADKREVK